VHERIEHLKALASRCQQFHNEQQAIRRAWQVSRQADALLSTFGPNGQAAGQQPAEDIGALDQHVAAVLDAYRKLGHDISGENS